MVEPPDIHLPPLVGAQSDSWAALLGIAPSLGPNWLLVGGQMVLLHEVERRAVQTRPTDDVDVVVDLRVAPSGLATVRDALTGGGFTQDGPDPDGVAHRFRRGRATIDVLAPDHLGSRANLAIGSGRTIEAPGTSQAFHRSEWRLVHLSDGSASAPVRRPTLVGAIIAKSAAALKIPSQDAAGRAKHEHDLDALACLAGPVDRAGAHLSKAETRLVRRILEESELTPLAAASLGLLVRPHAPG